MTEILKDDIAEARDRTTRALQELSDLAVRSRALADEIDQRPTQDEGDKDE